MDTIFNYIERNWGKAPQCAYCHSYEPVVLCGECVEHAYCNEKCQKGHWEKEHRMQCIGGGADIETLPRDLWGILSRFMNAEDVKNSRQVSRTLAKNTREAYFERFRWTIFTQSELDDPLLVKVAPFIKSVRISDDLYLSKLQKLGARLKEIHIDTKRILTLIFSRKQQKRSLYMILWNTKVHYLHI